MKKTTTVARCCNILSWLILISLRSTSVLAQQDEWVKVRKDTLRVELVESGEIGAVKSTIVSAPQIWDLDMQITDLVPEGALVDSGDIVVQFDPSSLINKLNTKKTELDMSTAELRRMRTEHEARIGELKRSVELAEYSLKLAQVQLEQLTYESSIRKESGELELLKAEIALKESKTRLEAQAIINRSAERKQELVILQARGEVNNIQRQLDQLTLRAPIAGMAVYYADWDGTKPQVGGKSRPGRGVVALPDLSRMQVKVPVNEVDASQLSPGQNGIVTLDAFPNKHFSARLISTTRIAAPRERNSQVKIFEAVLEIAERDSLLKPGMTAKLRLQLDLLSDVSVLPIGCVYEVNGEPVVFTKKSPKKPVAVQLGPRNDFYVSIEGLAEGTEVSVKAGVENAKPLGYAAYQKRLRPPADERQQFFTEMQKRNLAFDYEGFRNRPPEPPGGAPGGTAAMMKQLGLPAGEMGARGGAITITPEMMKQMPQMKVSNHTAANDSVATNKKTSKSSRLPTD